MQKPHKLLIVFICWSALLTLASQALATTPAADELLQLLNNIHTMQATFTQTLVNSQGVIIGPKIQGSILLERPGKFRWETVTPNKQLIIINKNNMLLYDPDLNQLIKRQIDYKRLSTPAALLSSSGATLKQSFTVVKLKPAGRTIGFKLIPKTIPQQDEAYQWIKINFSEGRLHTLSIADNLDQTTRIHFEQLILNKAILAKKFIFTPPPHTEIFNSH